jgi:hypothetical protein
LNLSSEKLVSKFAFKFNLCHYMMGLGPPFWALGHPYTGVPRWGLYKLYKLNAVDPVA